MSRLFWLAAAAAVLAVPASASRQQSSQPQNGQQNQASQAGPSPSAVGGQSQGQAAWSGSQQDSLAAAARKARAQKKDAPKAAKVFTNDDLPATGGISTVGAALATESSSGAATAKPAAGGDEKSWRDRFAGLRRKLEQDQQALEIMQRELGVLNVQQYTDPMQAMQQGYTRGDINGKTADIDAKKKQIEADQQAIDDAEEELRKSGGDPGWAQ
jgi:chromosome segregation ATPase